MARHLYHNELLKLEKEKDAEKPQKKNTPAKSNLGREVLVDKNAIKL